MYDERRRMMDGLKQYVISLIGAALICSVIKCFLGRNGTLSAIINVVCGIFLAITAFAPVIDIQIPDLASYIEPISNTASRISQDATASTKEEMAVIIKDEIRTYILKKATTHNMDVDVEVNLDDEKLIPSDIVIKGRVSPYNKTVLNNYIQETLGIPEENLQWVE